MSPIASRTPEGWPGRCPCCGATVAIQPSTPLDDAPCPNCGTLLWPVKHADADFLLVADELSAERRERILQISSGLEDGDSLDRVELLMELEVMFEVSVPDEAAEQMQSFADFIAWLLDRESSE